MSGTNFYLSVGSLIQQLANSVGHEGQKGLHCPGRLSARDVDSHQTLAAAEFTASTRSCHHAFARIKIKLCNVLSFSTNCTRMRIEFECRNVFADESGSSISPRNDGCESSKREIVTLCRLVLFFLAHRHVPNAEGERRGSQSQGCAKDRLCAVPAIRSPAGSSLEPDTP